MSYSNHYLPVILPEMGLHYYKPRPRSVCRLPEAETALTQRVKATFGGLQALGYDLDGVAFAHEASPQLSVNTARLWSLGKADMAIFPKIRKLHADYKAVVLLWDNLPAHKTAAVEAAARRHQLYLVYNLPYSPDLNPIEPGRRCGRLERH